MNLQVGVYIYDKKTGVDANQDDLQDTVTDSKQPPVASGDRYPQSQVTRLIMDTGTSEMVESDRRTPVDLQDIVEKLNNAIKDCRVKNNLKLDHLAELSPVHGQN